VSDCKREKRTAREKKRGRVSVMREKKQAERVSEQEPEIELKKGEIKR